MRHVSATVSNLLQSLPHVPSIPSLMQHTMALALLCQSVVPVSRRVLALDARNCRWSWGHVAQHVLHVADVVVAAAAAAAAAACNVCKNVLLHVVAIFYF